MLQVVPAGQGPGQGERQTGEVLPITLTMMQLSPNRHGSICGGSQGRMHAPRMQPSGKLHPVVGPGTQL